MDKKLILSPTKITAYVECPLKYKFLYIDKIGRFYYRPRPGNTFGGTIHRVLQSFHQPGMESAPVEHLIEEYKRSWVSAGFATEAEEKEFKEAGEQILRSYHSVEPMREARTLFTEKMVKWDMGDFVLSGRLDRLDEHADGALEIIDYKSGRLSSSKEEVRNDLAMSVYQYIVKKLNPDRRVFASIYCLAGGVKASAELTDEEHLEVEEGVTGVANAIMHSVEYEPKVTERCIDCDFHRLCSKQSWFRNGD